MPTCCCVPKCSNRGGVTFPKEEKLRKLWLIAIRRDDWAPNQSTVVCHAHFSESDYDDNATFHGTKRMNKILKNGAVPSIFQWSKAVSVAKKSRRIRAERRAKKVAEEPDLVHISHEEIIEPVSDLNKEMDPSSPEEISRNSSTQTSNSMAKLDITQLMFNAEAMRFYTGLADYEHFCSVLATLGPHASRLKYRWGCRPSMSVENQFLITLIKLRRHTTNFELGFWFDSSDYTVSNIFVTWINFMYRQWKRIDIWPSREQVSYFMPSSFKELFPSTRVTIDGMEIPVKKPGKPTAQQVTFSSYKNRNTLKVIVGITPGGLISHIPDAYGGSASDRILVQNSDLLEKCVPKDSVMADKGFNIQDMAAPHDVKINIPTFVKNTNQLAPAKLKQDRKIYSKRTHVERLIGLGKTYRILVEPLNDVETILGSRIVFVCLMLCNFRRCIVPKNAYKLFWYIIFNICQIIDHFALSGVGDLSGNLTICFILISFLLKRLHSQTHSGKFHEIELYMDSLIYSGHVVLIFRDYT